MSDADAFEPTDSDLEQVVDAARKDLGLGPAPRSAEQGIKDMDARILELIELKNSLLSQWCNNVNEWERAQSNPAQIAPIKVRQEGLEESIKNVNRDLEQARLRRAEYEAQLEGRN